jgi:hypothetical protein
MTLFWSLIGLTMGVAVAFPLQKTFPVLKSQSSVIQPFRPRASVLSSSVSFNEELRQGIMSIDGANELMMSQLNTIRQTQNFRLFSVDILASCEYMPQELFECYSETCEIYPVDDEQVNASVIVILKVLRRIEFVKSHSPHNEGARQYKANGLRGQ